MNVAVGDEASRVAGLDGAEPERRMRRLRWQDIRDVRTLDVLVVQRRRVQHWVFAWRIRAVNVDGQPRAVPHGNVNVPFLDHRSSPPVFRGADRRHFAIAAPAYLDP